jgi:hypothetical protein
MTKQKKTDRGMQVSDQPDAARQANAYSTSADGRTGLQAH